jgi:D-tyrosyl-tRNA(Tyr) deacylase
MRPVSSARRLRGRVRKDPDVRIVVQRVERAAVRVDGEVVGSGGPGLLLLVGVERGDEVDAARALAGKVARLRIFENDAGRFDRSVVDAGGDVVVVSQFTLLADTNKGNRPGFARAEEPAAAERLIGVLCDALRAEGLVVATGRFGARMAVELVNDGPVTIVLEG